MKISVIGHGNVGGALALRWADAGHEVALGVRSLPSEKADAVVARSGGRVTAASIAEAVEGSEVVVLAVPWQAAEDVVRGLGDLGGRILVDCTNPWVYGEGLRVGFTTSGAEEIAGWATNARVVKAMNQTGFETMLDPAFGDARASMFVAADDDDARQAILGLVEEIGFEALGVGELATARLLEPHAALWIDLALRHGQGRDFAWGILRR
ncbi:MAG: NAD(P)-binding domain-containing protein [Planctomycetota bacterium]